MRAKLLLSLVLLLPGVANAASLPRILASADNPVPKCVRPAALMDFVAERDAQLSPPRSIDPRYANLASLYQRLGQCVARPPDKCVAVRWDYAFFQMLIETNFLTFRRPNGVPAAVVPAATIISPASAQRSRASRASVSRTYRPAYSRICNTS